MKLSIALLAHLPAVLAAPVAVDTVESGIEAVEGTLEGPLSANREPNAVDSLGGIVKGVPLDGAKIPNVLNARDGDFISVGDTAVLIKPELEVLSERDGDDSAIPLSALTSLGGVAGAGSIGAVGPLGGVAGAGEAAGAGSIGAVGPRGGVAGAGEAADAGSIGAVGPRGGVAGAGEAAGAGSIGPAGPLSGVAGAREVAGAGSIGGAGPLSLLPGKRELSPAEILANAWKALSAAERDYERYPNEITKAAYTNAIAAVQALQKSSN
ncbi:hypothetical protein V502_01512 [Pseudogymnoascus sp. VKM F-4520 (FW-2644)]|nr:hypothetical protein V502_01512 [Pseudogymnoascus sp. VKM F-4520 (FW-2644)]